MWETFSQLEFMLALAETPGAVALVKRRKGVIVYKMIGEELDRERFVRGNFELNLVNGLVNGKGVQVAYSGGEFYFRVLRGMTAHVEVVAHMPMKYNGKEEQIPICVIEGTLHPDINSLALRIYGEVNQFTIQQTMKWTKDYPETTRDFPGGKVDFLLSDFELAGFHYSTRGNRSGCAFLHKKLGFIPGLGDLRDRFPDLEPAEVRKLYRKFGLTPSTNIAKLWGEKATMARLNSLIKQHKLRICPDGAGRDKRDYPFTPVDIVHEDWGKGLSDREAELLWNILKRKSNGKSTSKI